VSKRKAVLLLLLAVVFAAAIAVGVVGCANKSQPAAVTPSTNGGSAQPAQPNGSQRQFNPQQMQGNIKTALSSLVSKGTITQDQSDKVVQAYAQSFANRQQGSGQQGSGQPGSGQQASGQRQNPILTPLVSNGTLTQSQANAVDQAIRQAMPHNGRRPGVSTSGQTTTQ
jgi:polyhydroxyalkanoate synthesis regulator phasin